MDVFNISAGQAPKATESGSVRESEPQLQGVRPGSRRVEEDTFEGSAPASRVEGFVARLSTDVATGGDLRPDLIGKFRALMAVGALDTKAVADQAAAGMLGPESIA